MKDRYQTLLSEEQAISDLLAEFSKDREAQENLADVRYNEELNRREDEAILKEYRGEVIQNED